MCQFYAKKTDDSINSDQHSKVYTIKKSENEPEKILSTSGFPFQWNTSIKNTVTLFLASNRTVCLILFCLGLLKWVYRKYHILVCSGNYRQLDRHKPKMHQVSRCKESSITQYGSLSHNQYYTGIFLNAQNCLLGEFYEKILFSPP